MMSADQVRLRNLLARMQLFEPARVTAHERAIAEVAYEALRSAVAELSHRIHDGDYLRASTRPLPRHPIGASATEMA